MIVPIPAERIPAFWPALSHALAASVQIDQQRDWPTVARDIAVGDLMAWRITGAADGYALTTTGRAIDSPGVAFWIAHVGGVVTGHRRQAMSQVVDAFEQIARTLECDEIRIEGRVIAWGRLASGWRLSNGVLRKDL